jgi:hypothetical protein
MNFLDSSLPFANLEIRDHENESNVPCSTTNLGERQLHTPHLTLVAEAIFADELQLRVPILTIRSLAPRLEQRQARAQWPGDCTYRRADSNGRLGTW